MKILVFILVIAVNNVLGIFFHEPSFIEIKPEEETTEMDFGFSMGYQRNRRLVIGAPHSDLNGRVYTCSIEEVMGNNSVCRKAGIDVEDLANEFTREPNPDQHFCLGASIAATSDYFLTCAPLWMSSHKKQFPEKYQKILTNSFGTCFIYNGTAYRYEGLYEQHVKESIRNRQAFSGGVGWTTLLDERNDLLLIAKLLTRGDITYISISNPLKPANSILQYDLTFSDKLNTGYALASGYFSESGVNKTIYAYSMQNNDMTSIISFLKYNKRKNTLVRVKAEINFESINAMFGATLLGMDLNLDGYSELLVGAPAQGDDEDNYEMGALHIYTGGKVKGIGETNRMRSILGTKIGSRFGSAIASTDVDGDNFPEIIVSAPYEDFGLGAVYIISGFEVNRVLLKEENFKMITLSQLSETQIIRNKAFKSFGFSLQVIADVDENGRDELAVGCPESKRVILYRSISTIKVSVSTELVGEQVVRIKDNSFTVRVFVNITYPTKPKEIIGHLRVLNSITGSGLHIKNYQETYTINLSRKETGNITNVVVDIKNNEPGTYVFTTLVELNHEAIFQSKEFDPSKVALSLRSQTKSEPLYIERRCSGESCLAQLNMTLEWSGSDPYQLGTTQSETVTMRITNYGNTSYAQACVYFKVSGAQVGRSVCDNTPMGYKCLLDIPIRRDSIQSIKVPIDMSKPTNKDDGLSIQVDFFNSSCSQQSNFQQIQLFVPYKLESNVIKINGTSHDRNVTDSDVLDTKIKTFEDAHEYTIENNGVTLWKDVYAVVTLPRPTFIEEYKISSTFATSDCLRQDIEDKVSFNCTLNLEPHSVLNIIVTTEISEESVVKSLVDDKVIISSSLLLHLPPTEEKEEKTLTTVIQYRRVLSVAQNIKLIIIIATIVALITLAVVIFVLHKLGFFNRNTKKKLIEEKKEDERRKSLRRPTIIGQEDNNDTQTSKGSENDTLSYSETRDGAEFVVAPNLEELFNEKVAEDNLTTTILFEDISKVIQMEKPMFRRGNDFSWTAYYDIDDIYRFLTNTSKTFSKWSELIVGGQSYQGRSILGLRINTPGQRAKPVIFIESGIHAREWIAPATTTYFINELLTNTDPKIRALRDEFDWRIFPSVNPDGYHYSYTVDRLWRKTVSRSNYRCFGADPNRNWNYNWGQYSSTHNPCDYQTYAGSRPFSEIETRTLSSYIQSIDNLVAYVSFHSYAAMLLIPFSDSTQHVNNYNDLVRVGKTSLDYGYRVNKAERYQGPGTAAEMLYKASGGSIDWVRYALGTPLAYTYELRGNSFHWPPSRIREQGDEVTQMMLGLATEAKNLGYF